MRRRRRAIASHAPRDRIHAAASRRPHGDAAESDRQESGTRQGSLQRATEVRASCRRPDKGPHDQSADRREQSERQGVCEDGKVFGGHGVVVGANQSGGVRASKVPPKSPPACLSSIGSSGCSRCRSKARHRGSRRAAPGLDASLDALAKASSSSDLEPAELPTSVVRCACPLGKSSLPDRRADLGGVLNVVVRDHVRIRCRGAFGSFGRAVSTHGSIPPIRGFDPTAVIDERSSPPTMTCRG